MKACDDLQDIYYDVGIFGLGGVPTGEIFYGEVSSVILNYVKIYKYCCKCQEQRTSFSCFCSQTTETKVMLRFTTLDCGGKAFMTSREPEVARKILRFEKDEWDHILKVYGTLIPNEFVYPNPVNSCLGENVANVNKALYLHCGIVSEQNCTARLSARRMVTAPFEEPAWYCLSANLFDL